MVKKLLSILLIVFALQTSFANDGIAFAKSSYDNAISVAKSQGKLVFLDFTASWCLPCKKMERETFSNKSLGDFVNRNFVSFKVDNDFFWGMDLADKYDVKSFPTLLVLDTNGNVVKRITGFQTAEGLLGELRPLAY